MSEFSPPRTQKQLSYLVGWLCVLGWQVGNTAIGYLCGTIIQGLVILNNPSYQPQSWHGTLIIFAVLTFCFVFNAFLASKLPLLEGVVVVFHIAGFFAILIVLWVLADTTPASEVFTTFNNGGGWSTQGASCLVGILSPVFSFVGPDAATHMAEELQDASRSLPLAMVWTAIVNGAMGFVMIVTFCMTIGDLEVALDSPTGYPFIETFYNATHSKAGTSVMVALFIIMLLFGCVTNFATSSRQLWAFVSPIFSHSQQRHIANILTVSRPRHALLAHPRPRLTRPRHPPQRRHRDLRLLHAALAHQPGQRSRAEHHHFARHRGSPKLLHRVRQLHNPQTPSRRASAAAPLESGQMGSTDQRCLGAVHGSVFRYELLPAIAA